ncbi:L-rhamnose mutarotase [Pedobacter borealis]|uniref:L-rhamnose mutarotase n=1 Tax=Pedobacter borealis TaxID=475254 RepID=UPI001FD7E7C7|nr:L-rhamnose mutarotase [Pedobacter borealis]
MKNLKTMYFLALAFVLMVTACNPPVKTGVNAANKVLRYGSITGLKPEKMAYYKKLHAAVWPGVLKKITACNIHNYSIYLKEIEGKQYLFSYFEYTGNDFAADMKKMAADTTTQRWWKETAPTQIPLPDAAAKGETWSNMEEVFHKD